MAGAARCCRWLCYHLSSGRGRPQPTARNFAPIQPFIIRLARKQSLAEGTQILSLSGRFATKTACQFSRTSRKRSKYQTHCFAKCVIVELQELFFTLTDFSKVVSFFQGCFQQMPTSWKSNPSQTPNPESQEDVSWTDSAIFGMGSLVGASFLDPPSIDVNASSMDESRLRLAASVFANTHDGIVITDATGCILDINRAYAKISGYSSEEVIGKMPDFLKSNVHPIEFYEEIWRSLKKSGVWRGEISNRRKNGKLCPELLSISAVLDAFGEVTHYVAIYTDITDLKESQQKLEHLAYHDALTGLPNRVLLGDRILQALASVRRRNGLLAICFLDLDDFKPINDTYGHQAGDECLRSVASALEEASAELEANAILARYGGEEFVIALMGVDAQQSLALADEFRTAIAELTVGFEAQTIRFTASFGVVCAVPDASHQVRDFIAAADRALYEAKNGGRNTVRAAQV